MKQFSTLFLFVLLFVVNINSQPLFVETFNYNDGALMTMVGLNTGSPYYAIASVSNNVSGGVWTPGSTSTFDDPLMVESGALTYPGYSLSGEGKKLFCPNLAANSSNNRGFASFTSQQIVYYSMMINMKDVTGLSTYPSTNGEYFTGLWATGNTTNANYRGLLVFRGGSNPAKFQLGVRACQPTTVATTWVDVDLDVLTTYLVVVKYERNNPTCKASLWINPSLAGTEPTPDAVNNFGAVDPVGTNTDVARFGIYQRALKPHVWLGGIKIGQIWGDAPLPVELSSFASVAQGRTVVLNWSTRTEKNSDRFEVERSLESGSNWTTIASVKAAVLSNSPKNYTYSDTKLQSGKYQYRLKMIDNDGTFSYSSVEAAVVAIPKDFAVSQNYPNPFNPSTKIDYQVPVDAKVLMEVYNIAGQKVSELVNQNQTAGYYTVDFGGSELSSGVYVYRIVANDAAGHNFSSIKKMMLLK
jgi:hypothetical protein